MRGGTPARGSVAVVLAICVATAPWLTACSMEACSDHNERRLTRLVEVVLGEPGPTADEAENALVAAGAAAVLYVETGLYGAEAPGRRRLVRVLTRIGGVAAFPVLAHLAESDPDPEVRTEAAAGLRTLEGRPLP